MSNPFEDFIDFVGDTIETVGDFVSDTFDAVVGVIEDIGNAIGDAVEAVGDALSDIEDFAKPFIERYAIQVALVAMGIPPQFAGPMSAGMHTLAKGGSPEDAVKAAAVSATIQQVGQAVQGGMEAANADAMATPGGEPIYSPAEIAAATSAAQSAVSAAATGGDISQVLTSAAIGGVTGAAATEVYKATGSIAAANFVRVTTQSTLQGVGIKEAILMGASSSMVSYLQNMNKYANESADISRNRSASVTAYKNRVEGYNNKLDLYKQARDAGDVTTANNYARELNDELVIINNLATQIGNFNTQLKELSDKYIAEQDKAVEESKKTGFDFTPKTEQMLAAEQEQRDELADTLITLFSETEGRNYQNLQGIQVAGDLPFAIQESLDTLPSINEQVSGQTETEDEIRRTIDGTSDSGNPYQYTILIDKETGDVSYEFYTGDLSGDVTGDMDGRSIVSKNRPVFNDAGEAQQTSGIEEYIGQTPTLTEPEIAAINTQLRETRGTSIRGAVEQDLFDKELDQFEKELKDAEDDLARNKVRLEFAQKQRERLSQANRLPGTLQAQIDAEIETILDDYERSKGIATATTSRKEGVVASQQERTGTVSDEDIMRLIGLTPEEGEKYGIGTGGGTGFKPTEVKLVSEEPPEEVPEGEMELGGGEGDGEPPMKRFDSQGRPITTTVVAAGDRTREAGTPGISSRVTGEALVGILGEKEPLFGGDEDDQRAVWNRRSLRLRKALGL
jgi:predicted  nucleic acid-binding Zn-ribbon protein